MLFNYNYVISYIKFAEFYNIIYIKLKIIISYLLNFDILNIKRERNLKIYRHQYNLIGYKIYLSNKINHIYVFLLLIYSI